MVAGVSQPPPAILGGAGLCAVRSRGRCGRGDPAPADDVDVVGLAAWLRIFGFTLLHDRPFSAIGLALATVCVFVLAPRRTATPIALLSAGFFLLTPQVLDTGTVISPEAGRRDGRRSHGGLHALDK